MADKQVAVRFKAEGGVQLRGEFRGIGQEADQAFAQMNRGARSGSAGPQNFGFQVQDFAVQVGAGTSASQALAQQLPQLLSGFGLLGVVLGTSAAILVPIARYLFDTGEEAKTASEAIDGLVGSIRTLKEANANFSTEGIQQLIDKYGELDAKVVLLIERQRRLAEEEALRSARDVTQSFGAEFEGLFAYLDEYESRREQIMQSQGVSAQEAEGFRAMTEVVEFLNAEYGVTIERAREIEAALADMRAADSIPEMADAAATLTGLLEGSSLAGTELERTLLGAEDALRQLNAEGGGIGGWLGAAIDWAAGLAGNLWDGAAAAAAIRTGAAAAPSVGGGRSAGMGGPALDPYGFRDQLAIDNAVRGAIGGPSPGRSGGGGPDPNLDDLREAERLYESTRTEAERYGAEVDNLNRLLREGDIDAQLHARAMEAVREKYAEAANQGMTFGDAIRDISDTLVQAARDGKNLADALGDVFLDIAADLAASQLQRLLMSAFGGILGNFGLSTSSPILTAFSASSGAKAARAASAAGTAARAGGVTVNFSGGDIAREDVDVRQGTGPSGETQIDIMLKRKVQGMLATGQLDSSMRAAFGLRRVPA